MPIANYFLVLDPGESTGYAVVWQRMDGEIVIKDFGTIPYADITKWLIDYSKRDFQAIVAERAVARGIGRTSLINADVCSQIDAHMGHAEAPVKWIMSGTWKPVMKHAIEEVKRMVRMPLAREDQPQTQHEWDAICIGYYCLQFGTKLLEYNTESR